jgi:multiple sugar transport system permease protein
VSSTPARGVGAKAPAPSALSGAGVEAPAPPALDRGRAKRRASWRRRLTVLAFLSPWIAGFSIFFGYPLVMTGYLSFTHYDLLNPPRWIGLANYRYMLGTDDQIWASVKNTLWFIAVSVPLQVLFALGIAIMLTRAKAGVGVFRTVFYLPALVPPVAATLGFVYVLNPSTGPVNTLLGKIGIEGPLWFNDPTWAKPSLVMLSLWGVGNIMIIFLAAVLDVPRHLYESADLDGAGAFQRFRWVTLPLVSPVILFSVVLGVIQGMQYFTQAYVAASVAAGQASQAGGTSTLELGYPEGSTLFYPILLYYHGFRFFDMGYASAMAALLLVVAFALTALIIHGSRRFVHYQGAAR